MIPPFNTIVFLVLLFTNVNSKNPENSIQRGFYYWKSGQSYLSKEETDVLKNVKAQKLYVKFFEVNKDPLFTFKPVAKTELGMWNYANVYAKEEDSLLSLIMSNMVIIPTIFIKNDVFMKATTGSLDSLADNIDFLINKTYKDKFRYQHKYKEVQIDCDWTVKTEDNYFYFLKRLKKITNKTISCTLRLYPYKYSSTMGIPPVDKATLMCYNLINSLDNQNKNAILDNHELESYLKGTSDYPLHLDLAIPVFSWMLLYHNNSFAGKVNPQDNDLKESIKQVKPLWYEVEKDVVIDNLYLRAGDKIKYEEITEKIVRDAIALIKRHVPIDANTTITLFHLDPNVPKEFNNETLNSFYTDFTGR